MNYGFSIPKEPTGIDGIYYDNTVSVISKEPLIPQDNDSGEVMVVMYDDLFKKPVLVSIDDRYRTIDLERAVTTYNIEPYDLQFEAFRYPYVKLPELPKGMNERQAFIAACFYEGDLQEFYRRLILSDYNKWCQQFHQGYVLNKLNWSPSRICKYSKEYLTLETIDIWPSYWYPNVWCPVHKDLLKQAKTEEAYECQKIDKNCNDCKHMKRIDAGRGTCLQFGHNMCLFPNTSMDNDCFVHRLDQTGNT